MFIPGSTFTLEVRGTNSHICTASAYDIFSVSICRYPLS
jgi:hypothetical protein